MISTRKVLSNSIIYGLSSIISGGMLFLMMPIYTRIMSTEEYGLVGLVTSLAALLVIPLVFGMDNSIGRFHFILKEEEKPKFNGTIIISILFLSALGTAIYLLLGEIIAKYLVGETPFFPFVLMGILIALFKPLYSIFQSMLQVRQRAVEYFINAMVYLVLNVGLNIFFLLTFESKVFAMLLGNVLTGLIFFAVSLFEMHRRKFMVLRFDKVYFKQSVKYSYPLVPGPLLASAALYVIKLIIEKFYGLSFVGLYDTAIQFGLIIGVAQLAANRALFPFSYECYKQDKKQSVINLTSILLVLYMILCGCVAIFSRELLFILGGKEFQTAWVIIPIIAIAYLIKSLNYCYDNNILYSLKGPKFILINAVITNCTLILITLLLIKPLGLYAPAIGLLISNILGALISFFMAKKLYYVNYSEHKIILKFISVCVIIFTALVGNYFFAIGAFHIWNLIYKMAMFIFMCVLLYLTDRTKINGYIKDIINKKKQNSED